jgi:hypothetical protein
MSQLVGENSKDRWYPNSIDNLKDYLNRYKNLDEEANSGLVSNLAYNLQYVEYLRKTLIELNLSTVLKTQTIKSFIIASLSIIEAISIVVLEKKRNINFKEVIKDLKLLNNCPYSREDLDILDELRILRNHIHLNKATDSNKTDFKKFWIKEYNEAKRLLYILLTSEFFKSKATDLELFRFLNFNYSIGK